jgi:hypothetical protein
MNIMPAAAAIQRYGEGRHSSIDIPDLEEEIFNLFTQPLKIKDGYYQDSLTLGNSRWDISAAYNWSDRVWELEIKRHVLTPPAWDLQRCA